MSVLAAEFIGRDNQVAVSGADGFLTIWDLGTYKLLRYTRLKDVQIGMRFCPAMDVLVSWGVGDFSHEILVFDVDTLKVLHVLDGHAESVKDVCEVASPLSSTNPGAVERCWDPMLGRALLLGEIPFWVGFRDFP